MKQKIAFSLVLILFATRHRAQVFLRQNNSAKELTFKQLQLNFNDWKKTHNLKKEKHWKAFKRWEMETQLHTNARGEPDFESTYIQAAIDAAAEKEPTLLQRANNSSWYPVGPYNLPNNETGYMENGMGRINCIAFDPTNPARYFVGVGQGGLWKTSNNGTSWTPLTDNLPITRISDVAIDPNNTNIMYISVCDFEYIGFGLHLGGEKRNTHFGLGVYKTTNGGTTWSPTGLSFVLTNGDASLIRKVLISPVNSNSLVACGVSGMYTSSNGGVSWTHVLDSLFWDLVQDPVSPNVLYAATGWVKAANAGYAAIYKSSNFGASWSLLSTGIPLRNSVQRIKLAVSKSDNNYVYAATVDTLGGLFGIYKSANAGVSWQMVFNNSTNLLEGGQGTSPGGQGNYDLGFSVDPADKDKVYVGGVNLWGSNDGALTFNPIAQWTTSNGPTIHGDIHFIDAQPSTGNYFVCSDGGIYRTTSMILSNWNTSNWPTLWSKISDGLNITSFYRISSSKNSNGLLLAGAQDNGSFYFDGTGWSTVFGGDGMDNYVDTVTNGRFIASSQYGNFGQTANGGLSFNLVNANVNFENAEWTTPLTADYKNYGTLYAGFSNVTKSTDGGNNWTAISNFPSPGLYDNEISALAISRSNDNTLYACKRVRYEYNISGSVYNTFDGGTTWNNITAGLPDSLYYTSIDISESDKETACITMAGFTAGCKIFKTTDGGTTWQNISYNLPNIPANCVKFIPGSMDIMLATDLGVFILNTNSTSWVNHSIGLPNVIISDIEFNPALNKVYLTTFGRGIWASDLNDLVTVVKTNNLTASQFTLYPSVSHGNFKITGPLGQAFKMEVVDVNGKIVHSEVLSGKPDYSFNLSLAPGMYYAKITQNNGMEVKRFIID